MAANGQGRPLNANLPPSWRRRGRQAMVQSTPDSAQSDMFTTWFFGVSELALDATVSSVTFDGNTVTVSLVSPLELDTDPSDITFSGGTHTAGLTLPLSVTAGALNFNATDDGDGSARGAVVQITQDTNFPDRWYYQTNHFQRVNMNAVDPWSLTNENFKWRRAHDRISTSYTQGNHWYVTRLRDNQVLAYWAEWDETAGGGLARTQIWESNCTLQELLTQDDALESNKRVLLSKTASRANLETGIMHLSVTRIYGTLFMFLWETDARQERPETDSLHMGFEPHTGISVYRSIDDGDTWEFHDWEPWSGTKPNPWPGNPLTAANRINEAGNLEPDTVGGFDFPGFNDPAVSLLALPPEGPSPSGGKAFVASGSFRGSATPTVQSYIYPVRLKKQPGTTHWEAKFIREDGRTEGSPDGTGYQVARSGKIDAWSEGTAHDSFGSPGILYQDGAVLMLYGGGSGGQIARIDAGGVGGRVYRNARDDTGDTSLMPNGGTTSGCLLTVEGHMVALWHATPSKDEACLVAWRDRRNMRASFGEGYSLPDEYSGTAVSFENDAVNGWYGADVDDFQFTGSIVTGYNVPSPPFEVPPSFDDPVSGWAGNLPNNPGWGFEATTYKVTYLGPDNPAILSVGHYVLGIDVSLCYPPGTLHVPYKRWPEDAAKEGREPTDKEIEKWKINQQRVERWGRTGLQSTCLLSLPYKDQWSARHAEENYLALERWANQSCTCKVRPLHIPYKKWGYTMSWQQEEMNYLTIERWAATRG